jgi:hypothetical protein
MDILGFANRILNLSEDHKEIAKIARTLRKSDQHARETSTYSKELGIKVGIFSDTILIMCPNPDAILANMAFGMAAIFQVALLLDGCFLRGAAVVDSCYARGNVAFGPALVRAHDMEKLAIWPKVVIAPNFLEQLEPVSNRTLGFLSKKASITAPPFEEKKLKELDQHYKNLIQLSLTWNEDGLNHIDYLMVTFAGLMASRWVSENMNEEVPYLAKKDLLASHRDAIVESAKFVELTGSIDVLTKYHSLAVYHNKLIGKLRHTLSEPFDPQTATPFTYLGFLYYNAQTIFAPKGVIPLTDEKKIFLTSKIRELSQLTNEFELYTIDLPKVFSKMY